VAFLPLRHDALCSQPASRLLHHLPQLGGLQSRTEGGQLLVSPPHMPVPMGSKLGPPIAAPRSDLLGTAGLRGLSTLSQ
jgi:hypothetical protein